MPTTVYRQRGRWTDPSELIGRRSLPISITTVVYLLLDERLTITKDTKQYSKNNDMVTEQHFFFLINWHFDYLDKEFGFSIKPVVDVQRSCYIDFQKNEILIRVLYSRTNHYIDVTIYNHISRVEPDKYSWKYSVALHHLIFHYKADYDEKRDYDSFMPKHIPLEESVNKVAKLFKEYASKIIMGQEWISWGEITGYTQYVPPELPRCC